MHRLLLALAAPIAVSVFLAGVSVTLWPSAKADDSDDHDSSQEQPTDDTAVGRQPQGPPAIIDPPRAVLRLPDGLELVAGVGTRCWTRMCVDMVGPVSNPDALEIDAGDSLALSFEAGTPTSTSSAWIRVDEQPSELADSGGRLWKGFYPDLRPDSPRAPAAELESGEYLYVIQAFFGGQGDVMYAFYLKVA